jgi:hypothetical protein
VIEWVPRSRGDNGWCHVVPSAYLGHAVLEDRTGVPVVRVPVLVQDWVRIAAARAARRLAGTVRVAFVVLLLVGWLVQESDRALGRVWPVWIAAGVLVVVAAYRLVRLRRWRRGRRADLLLSRDGVAVDDRFVPWYEVERVVRFHFLAPLCRRGTRNFLALQVHDYVAVRGLSPFEAGLANLTRRRLVILAEAAELSHPDEFAAALDRLVADPDARDLLAGPEGCRLVDEGPARAFGRSP